MTIEPGTKLGPYEITGVIGAGGMGEVYRAHDSKLERDVAIKVLPAAFVEDRERLARFEREAKLLAQLQHPHIASIFGLEESGKTPALVMELVEGPTLSERLAQGPLSLEEALPIARQIAEALEYAHERGVIHRDLKPANVKLTGDGQVKILDFGLAKAMDTEGSQGGGTSVQLSHSPTMTLGGTVQGMILGSAGYMAPEQAKGFAVDKRADIWALGVVIYEMLTGRRLFEGDSVPDTLARVLQRDVDFEALPSETPAAIRRLLHRCLERNPKQRLRDIGEARIAIEGAIAAKEKAGHPGAESIAAEKGERGGSVKRALLWALVAALGVVAGFALSRIILSKTTGTQPLSARLALELPAETPLAAGNFLPSLAFSPDGEQLAYIAIGPDGVRHLAVRRLDSTKVKTISGTQGAEDPFFSPDGQWIAFWSHWKLRKVRASGAGLPEALCTSLDFRGGTWAGHTIVFAPNQLSGLFKVDQDGGTPEPLTKLRPDELSHRFPHALPDGNTILFSDWKKGGGSPQFNPDRGQIMAVSLSSGKRTEIGQGSEDVLYSPAGYLLYVQTNRLLAVPFDAKKLAITGDARVLLEPVVTQANTGAAQFAVSRQGALAWIPGRSVGHEVRIERVGRDGKSQPIFKTDTVRRYPTLSSDDHRLLVEAIGPNVEGIWLMSIDGTEQHRVAGQGDSAIWLPDGRHYLTNRVSGELSVWSIDGSAPEKQLVKQATSLPWATSVASDGTIAYDLKAPDGNIDAWIVDAKGGAPKPFLVGPADEGGLSFSPDGKYAAYISDRSGRFEVYVTTFPDKKATWQISTGGGSEVIWQRDGKEIVYRSGANLIAVPVSTKPSFQAGNPSVLFHYPYNGLLGSPDRADYDVARDGSWFLMVSDPDLNQSAAKVEMALDWPRVFPAK